jgi:hypothetical protein
MAAAAAFGSPILRGLSELPAAVSVECSTWNATDEELLVAKEGGGYVSRETLGTAEGVADKTQIAAGDLIGINSKEDGCPTREHERTYRFLGTSI